MGLFFCEDSKASLSNALQSTSDLRDRLRWNWHVRKAGRALFLVPSAMADWEWILIRYCTVPLCVKSFACLNRGVGTGGDTGCWHPPSFWRLTTPTSFTTRARVGIVTLTAQSETSGDRKIQRNISCFLVKNGNKEL